MIWATATSVRTARRRSARRISTGWRLRDVASSHPEVVARMRAYLDAARTPAREYPPEVSSYRYVGQEHLAW
jgi:hypothetical protein